MTNNEQPSGCAGMRLAAPRLGVFGRLLTMVAGAALLAAVFMFSVLALAVVLVGGLLGFAYLKWKTRHLSRFLRDRMPSPANPDGSPASPDGRVIEGEVIDAAEYEARGRSPSTGDRGTNAPTRHPSVATTDSGG